MHYGELTTQMTRGAMFFLVEYYHTTLVD